MVWETVTVDSPEVDLIKDSVNLDKIYYYALKHACNDWHGVDEDTTTSFFSDNRLLKIWNLYPEIRGPIVSNLILRISRWKDSAPDKVSETLLSNIKQIAKAMHLEMSDNISISWIQTRDLLERNGLLEASDDFKKILSRISENGQTSGLYSFWLKRYMKTLGKGSEEEFEKLYSSIKRAPGATEVRREILRKAIDKCALSEKLLKKIAKSAPISLRRTIVVKLSNQKAEANQILFYRDKTKYSWRSFTEDEFAKARKIVDNTESKLMLFTPVQDTEVQRNLIDSLEKENLVWVVPAVSALNISWLSSMLQSKMD